VAALGGIAVMVPSVFSACQSDASVIPSARTTLDFNTVSGALNLLWATVQLQEQFYAIVLANPYVGMLSSELSLFSSIRTDMRFLDTAFPFMFTSHPLVVLRVNFQSVDFSDRTSVMNTAVLLHTASVQGVHGAMMAAKDAESMIAVASVGSVLAREAARTGYLIDVVANGATGARPSFGLGLTSAGHYLDSTMTPPEWVTATAPYLTTVLSTSGV